MSSIRGLPGVLPALFSCLCLNCFSQQLADPCFTSIQPIGRYYNSDDIVNLCGTCYSDFVASDLIEWNGTEWIGTLPLSNISRPPPGGCNVRAIWLGYNGWTIGGEGVAFRLDTPLKAGHTYTFTFTYSKDGRNDESTDSAPGFAPAIYTSLLKPEGFYDMEKIGNLPPVFDWTTKSITFVAKSSQNNDVWVGLRAFEVSGSILSHCELAEPILDKIETENTTICQGDTIVVRTKSNKAYRYLWNTGETTPSINVTKAGTYSVLITNHYCESRDSVVIRTEDCETRMVMPNFFSPNGDSWNEIFQPLEVNYVDSGRMVVFNRWEEEIFNGPLLAGWDGGNAASGVYYYQIKYIDRRSRVYIKRGAVTLRR